MRRYRLQVGSAAIDLSAPDFQGILQGRFGIIRDLVSRLGSLVITLFLVAVSLIPLFHVNFESITLFYGLYAVLLLLAGWAIVSLLVGSKFTVDPPLFVPVLLFALLTTTAYLLSPNDPLRPTDPRNTFGVDGARFIAAIGVITFIFLFYFMVTYLRNARRIMWTNRAFLLGATLLPVAFFITTRLKLLLVSSAQMDAVNLVLAVWIPMSLLLILFRPLRKLSQAGLILSLVVSVILSFQDFNLVNNAVVAVILLISLITYLWFRSAEFENVVKYVRENIGAVFTGERDWQEFISQTRAMWFLGFVLVWIVLTIVTAISTKYDLASTVNVIASEYRSAFQGLRNLRTLVVGNGAGARITAVTFADVISFQGLLGVAAYVVISAAVVRELFTRAKKYLMNEKSNGSMAWAWFPVIIGVPLLALVAKLNMTVSLWWWIGAALLSAVMLLQYREKEVALWETWKVKSEKLAKVLPFAQIVMIVVIVGVGITLLNLLAQLFTQGII